MSNKDLHIFVYDRISASDNKIIKAIKYIVKKVVNFIDYVGLIISDAVKGFTVDINSPPYKLVFTPSLDTCLAQIHIIQFNNFHNEE